MSKTEKTFHNLMASDIVKSDHSLYSSLVKFCGDNKVSKRQARKFLQKFPEYRKIIVEDVIG